MSSILVVEDEPIVRDVVVRYLAQAGFATRQAADGETAKRLIEIDQPDLVVLDVMLPGMDGLELCRWIRRHSNLPVIMVTALGDESDRIVGLELGADDYVSKPFSPRELVARVRSVLRRASAVEPVNERRIVAGALEIDPARREVRRAGVELTLTPREFDLLWFLASHPRHVFTRDELMERLWGYRSATDTGTVTVHIRRLREKVEADPSSPQHLQTVWGVGYRFVP